jgi:hypothetical protein
MTILTVPVSLSQDLDSRGCLATTKTGHFRISANLRRGCLATTAVVAVTPPQLKFRRGCLATTGKQNEED